MNLPGAIDYDPILPWVSKVRLEDGVIACDIFIYVDDVRITGCTMEEAWKSAHRVGCILSWLVIQDAARKRRNASRTAGPWAGSVVYTTSSEVFVLVTQEKWDRGKKMIQEILNGLVKSVMVSRRRLQQVRGYLNHIAMTYPILMTHLMGFHLTIDGWRKNCDREGWRIGNWVPEEDGLVDKSQVVEKDNGPSEVEARPRLKMDLEALNMLMSPTHPPLRTIRSSRVCEVYYGFGDASGSAFGATFGGKGSTYFEYGQWTTEGSEQSSNWRELSNLVDSLASYVAAKTFDGSEVFLFTDNTTAEATYWKELREVPSFMS